MRSHVNRRTALIWPLLLAAIATVAGLSSCSNGPDEPNYNNPFDPESPTGGDAFDLQGGYQASTQFVRLTWRQQQGHDIIIYRVLHAVTDVETEYQTIFEREATASDTLVQNHENPVPTQTNYYKIQALDATESFTRLSDVIAVPVAVPPRILVGENDGFARVRYDTVTVKIAGYDSVIIADGRDFTGVTDTLAAGPDSLAVFLDWDLGPAASNGDSVLVFAAGYSNLAGFVVASDTSRIKMTVNVSAGFSLPDDASTVATRQVDLVIDDEGAGVDSMRFAPTVEELATVAWQPGGPVFTGYELVDTPNPQTIHGEFLNDFRFSLTADEEVQPDDLSAATTQLLLPGNRIVTDPVVTVVNDAVASDMRLSLFSNFEDTTWEAYADTTTFDLGTDPGLRVLYVQFRNYWVESGVFADFAIVSAADVLVEFLAPQQDDIVRGGYPMQILGRAYSPAGDAVVDSVKVDVADGNGFQLAEGTTEWRYLWNVPRLGGDTDWPLLARSYYQVDGQPDSSTAVISVTVSQLAVTILEPASGDTVTAGTDVTIAGDVYSFSGGPDIDSLVVVIPDTTLYPAIETEWSTVWTPAPVGAVVGYRVIARVHAAELVEADTVDVFVKPEPVEE